MLSSEPPPLKGAAKLRSCARRLPLRVILLDTSGLLSALDSSQTHHSEAAASLSSASPPLLLSPFVLAELDYLTLDERHFRVLTAEGKHFRLLPADA